MSDFFDIIENNKQKCIDDGEIEGQNQGEKHHFSDGLKKGFQEGIHVIKQLKMIKGNLSLYKKYIFQYT